MVEKYFISVRPKEIVNDLKKLRIDMLEYEKDSIRPHPSVVFGRITKILDKMGIRVDDNTMER